MKAFVTGGAGFIGTHLVRKLLKENYQVIVYDNFSSSVSQASQKSSKNLKVIKADVLDSKTLQKNIENSDIVFHLCANADVRKGGLQTDLDLQQEAIATYNVLEAMRVHKIKKIVFPSSMTVYGKVTEKTVSEMYGPCLPISLYGAGKLASEGLISAFSESFGIQSWIFRFSNVIGGRATHGVIFDLIRKLIKDPYQLEVLGNGNQTKPYIYISDALNGMFFAQHKARGQINIYNIGTSDSVSVKDIVTIIINLMKLKKVKLKYAKTTYGWVGDVPTINLDISKLSNLGFTPTYSSFQAVELTVRDLLHETAYFENEAKK